MVAARTLSALVRSAREHVAGSIRGADPEELHDLRVAVRRLRAALRLFERALPRHARHLKRARLDLREAGQILGKARDLDVQVARLSESLGKAGARFRAAASRVVASLQNDRALARGAMVTFLTKGRFNSQLARVDALIRRIREWPGGSSEAAASSGQGPAWMLRRPAKRVLRAISRARNERDSPGAFHALRIGVKRLRYAVEFLGPSPGFPTKGFLRKMRYAQARLGALQDATVELALVGELKARLKGDLAATALLAQFGVRKGRDHARLLAFCARMLAPLEAEVRRLMVRSRMDD